MSAAARLIQTNLFPQDNSSTIGLGWAPVGWIVRTRPRLMQGHGYVWSKRQPNMRCAKESWYEDTLWPRIPTTVWELALTIGLTGLYANLSEWHLLKWERQNERIGRPFRRKGIVILAYQTEEIAKLKTGEGYGLSEDKLPIHVLGSTGNDVIWQGEACLSRICWCCLSKIKRHMIL